MKQCVVLVGGKGTRLGDVTVNFPKPLLSINSKPFLEYLLSYIERYGFKEVLLLAGHANIEIIKFANNYKNSSLNVEVIVEKTPLGTGGSLINAYEKLDDIFFMLNGDSLLDGNWLSIISDLKEDINISMALTEVSDSGRYGAVKLSKKTVVSFEEKRKETKSIPGLINAGIYCVRKKILKDIGLKKISFEKDILPALVSEKKVAGKKIAGYFIDIGTQETLKEANLTQWLKNRKAVILDRDGTLNEDRGYTYKAEDLIWKPGAKEFIKNLNKRNYYVFVATNQSGIARGKYSEDDMHKFHDKMQEELMKSGAYIDKFYYCPYHRDGIKLKYKKESNDRKPNTGMLEKITKEWSLNKKNLFFIGDSASDLECANNFKIKAYKYNGKDDLMTIFKKNFFK